MFCVDCEPTITPTHYAKKIIKILQSLNYSFFFFILIKLILGDINGFLNDFIISLSIYMTYRTANYFTAAITIFILLIQIVIYSFQFLLILQNSFLNMVQIDSTVKYLYVIIIVLSLLFYYAFTYFTFLAYREFKAIYREESTGSNNYRNELLNILERLANVEDRHEATNAESKGFVAFQGKGTSWGKL